MFPLSCREPWGFNRHEAHILPWHQSVGSALTPTAQAQHPWGTTWGWGHPAAALQLRLPCLCLCLFSLQPVLSLGWGATLRLSFCSRLWHQPILAKSPSPGVGCWSASQLCLTLCSPMDCSTPGFPVLHYLPGFAQIHVHWVGDAIQPSHPLPPSSAFALSLSQHQGLFQSIGSSHQVVKRLELQLQYQCFQWIIRIDFL